MEEIPSPSSVTETLKESAETSLNFSPVKSKPEIPPKPSKSIPVLNQSFLTDDSSSGVNSDTLSPVDSTGSGHSPKNQIQGQFPDESGDRSQMQMLPAPIATPNPSDEDAERDGGINTINSEPSGSGCPFYKLHHKRPTEFLSLPQIPDEDQSLLLQGIDDLSTDVDHKIRFIVGNLENCGGVWPMMFVEKLNRLIASADFEIVKACFFDEELSLIDKLVGLYRDTKRCSILFRYWCTFYNVLARNLVPCLVLGNSGVLELFQRDFILATQNECKCKDDAVKLSRFTCSSKSEADVEHSSIPATERMQILCILMIPLLTARAGAESSLDCETDTEAQFISTVLKFIEDKLALSQDEDEEGPLEPNSSVVDHLKVILVHVFLAYNLKYSIRNEHERNTLVEIILEDDGSGFKTRLIQIFEQEYRLLMKGYLEGVGSLVQFPLGFQTAGVNGPMKLLINILDSDKGNYFNVDEIRRILNITSGIQNVLKLEEGVWNDKTEEIENNCKILVEVLELKLSALNLMTASSENTEINLDDQDELSTVTSLHGSDCCEIINSTDIGAESDENQGISGDTELTHSSEVSFTNISQNNEEVPEIDEIQEISTSRNNNYHPRLKTDRVMEITNIRPTNWPVEILMKCFGCSKRTATVSPTQSDDLDL